MTFCIEAFQYRISAFIAVCIEAFHSAFIAACIEAFQYRENISVSIL